MLTTTASDFDGLERTWGVGMVQVGDGNRQLGRTLQARGHKFGPCCAHQDEAFTFRWGLFSHLLPGDPYA